MDTAAKNQIQDGTFYIGEITWNESVSAAIVKANEQQKTWTGKIGLMNASDYLYASTDSSCAARSIYNDSCKNNNWLYNSSYTQWTINASNISAYSFVGAISGKLVAGTTVDYTGFVSRPVIHLKTDIKITPDGTGTASNPYIIQ